MRIFIVFTMLALSAISGCATKSNIQILPSFSYSDEPEKSRLVVHYENKTSGRVCLLPEDWPNELGFIDQANERMFLVVSGTRYPIRYFNMGYCIGGCALVLKPGESSTRAIPYNHFDLPKDLEKLPKSLDFDPRASKC